MPNFDQPLTSYTVSCFPQFENNLMAESPHDKMDPEEIDATDFLEASSVSFFEARLFLRGTFEDQLDLLGGVQSLLRGTGPSGSGHKGVPTWVVQV
jgi:hypothetical protein